MVGMPHVWGVDPYNSQKWSDVRTNVRGGYSVHSHLFQHLEPDTRYEVIVQSKNHFGWSEPTKPFIFTTRYKGTYNYTQKCRKRFHFLCFRTHKKRLIFAPRAPAKGTWHTYAY